MAENPYKKYATAVAEREQGLRAGLSNVLNPAGESQRIAEATGAGGPINLYEVPSVAGLANIKAYTDTQSQLRESSAKAKSAWLPSYAKSYRQYLQWRYPKRYGGGSSSSENPYGMPTQTSAFIIPELPPLPNFPK